MLSTVIGHETDIEGLTEHRPTTHWPVMRVVVITTIQLILSFELKLKINHAPRAALQQKAVAHARAPHILYQLYKTTTINRSKLDELLKSCWPRSGICTRSEWRLQLQAEGRYDTRWRQQISLTKASPIYSPDLLLSGLVWCIAKRGENESKQRTILKESQSERGALGVE